MVRITFFILFLFLTFPQTGCYSQNAVIVVNKPSPEDDYFYDFGQVKEDEVLKHNFTLKNTSGKVLNIKDVNTSCSCTVSKVEKKSILPEETTLIEVNFDTKGYSGQTQQYIYVHTDNLDNPILRFIIKASVNSHKQSGAS